MTLSTLFKVSQQDTPIGVGSAEFTNKRNQRMARKQYILNNVSQNKHKNMFLLIFSHNFFIEPMFLKNLDVFNRYNIKKIFWVREVWSKTISTSCSKKMHIKILYQSNRIKFTYHSVRDDGIQCWEKWCKYRKEGVPWKAENPEIVIPWYIWWREVPWDVASKGKLIPWYVW